MTARHGRGRAPGDVQTLEGSGGVADEAGRRCRPPTPEEKEFPLYAALKLQVCGSMARKERATSATTEVLRQFTARRLKNSVVPGKRRGENSTFTDLFGASSYYLRERLQHLNHGTIIERTGRGLRNASVYEWREPITPSALEAYRRLYKVMGPAKMTLAPDIHAVVDTFGDQTFHPDDFIRCFIRRHRDQLGGSSSASSASANERFSRFLRARLRELQRGGYVKRTRGGLHATEKAEEGARWFELFVAPVEFLPGDQSDRRA